MFEDLLYQNVRQVGAQSSQDTQLPSGLMLVLGVRTVATEKLFTQGNLVQTNNAFDVAVEGRGFIQVLLPDGNQAYTRDGSLAIDNQGQLVTSSGYVVQPAVTVPDNAPVCQHRNRWYGDSCNPRHSNAHPVRRLAVRGFCQPRRFTADGQKTSILSLQPVVRLRLERQGLMVWAP